MTDVNKKSAAPQKKGKSLLYSILKTVATVLLHTVLPVKYHNADRLAIDPPYILIGNHNAMLDPVIMGVAVKKHQVTFIGKKELTKNKIGEWFFKHLHMISVDRHNSDMEAMRACMRVTKEGGILGIFPEGTRHHQGLMEEMESGVGLIALRSRVPVVPIYITGKLKLFRRLHVYVGDPIPTEDLREMGVNRESCELFMQRITATYAALHEAHTKA